MNEKPNQGDEYLIRALVSLEWLQSDGRLNPNAIQIAAQARQAAEQRGKKELQHKLWNVASHATGGNLGGRQMEEVCAMSINEISLAVTAFRNRLWNDAEQRGMERERDRCAGVAKVAWLKGGLNLPIDADEAQNLCEIIERDIRQGEQA